MIMTSTNEQTLPLLLRYLPSSIRRLLIHVNSHKLEEIRLRLGRPLCIYLSDTCHYIAPDASLLPAPQGAYTVTRADMEHAFELICEGSVYALEQQISQGFVTVRGGHRIGIVGKAVMQGGHVSYIKEISGLNYRFARQIPGAADRVMPSVLDNGRIKNTLLIAAPQCGKTTMLRDMARQLSGQGKKVCIIDERSEIAGMANGISGYELGAQCDVLDACPKAVGMMMALRAMSPQVIITDEIGQEEDMQAIRSALSCGVSVITSIHGESRQSIGTRPNASALLNLFDCVVTLSKRCGSGTIEEVYCR